ncbi:M28 family peptidase [Sphingobacterium deserti]|uniref:Peptidase M28 n=1 Tax=Sphingobacterium deserti TaxID=1229276 RepID=A0A0B8T2B0_9SPHI|nr:M28 family peptidase [Sphingobacterium deserti]KGE15362.1 peptidase M28 [Sphingobacterium deserti]
MLKNWIKVFVLLQALHSCVVAQDPVQLKYADLLTEQSAKTQLTLLASPAFEGRGTGQKGGEKTAQYLAEQFKSFGLKPPVNGGYFQPLKLVRSSYVVKTFTLDGKSYENGKDFYVQGDNPLANFNAAEVICVGFGIQDAKHNDLNGIDIRDKVVLVINEDEPTDANGNSLLTGTAKKSEWSTSRLKRIQELAKHNPKMILAYSSTVPQMIERFGSRITAGRFALDSKDAITAEKKVKQTAPVVNITAEIANGILAKKKTNVDALKKKPRSFKISSKFVANMGATKENFSDPNVLGLLEGTDLKDEIVVISGHYDHDGILPDGTIYPGADDNGSGTVGVLELAKAFTQAKKDGKGPRRSILFIGFAAEEKGLLGSQFYSENPIFPLSSTVTCLNMDMIGRIDDKHLNGNHNYIHVIGSDKLSSELYQINKKSNELYTKMEIDYMYDDPKDPMRIYYRSDQYNFAKHGIPVTFYFSGLHPHYHTPDDTVDKIDFPMMVKREKLVFHTAWEVANRDARLVVDSNKE